ncbi:hypothetical protein CC1G_06461 [Coprinopsis cinerea okayama7|uniref:Uncharacterized protein n=1 Tax=Coprinopsis cinerea (strain Okayama-7 / 130 / ATCC MYA-4618 / FGSC 9003) TaxID=240176 RepID=A8NN67_COPC7|nr:hypothetical protein CC1G_06461 [Coprinopsis cinerea okayama7\|eukprot:XP_001835058.1 hypothetical protein CC1G_06461 [Coprinopsis cinerea okayama7\
MVHVSTQALLTALAASPAIAAPLARQFESAEEQFSRDYVEPEFDARDFTEALDVRDPFIINKGLWEFGKKALAAMAMGGGMGVAMAPAFFAKEKGKRSFIDEGELDARDFFDGDELEAREPINLQGLKAAASAVKTFVKANNRLALPIIGGTAFGLGAWGRKKTLRSFEEDLDARDVFDSDELHSRADDMEYLVVRADDGSYHLVARDPNIANILKAGPTLVKGVLSSNKIVTPLVKAAKAIKNNRRLAYPMLGATAFGLGAWGRKKTLRSFDDDLDVRGLFDSGKLDDLD